MSKSPDLSNLQPAWAAAAPPNVDSRPLNEPQWPMGGFTGRKFTEDNYTVNVYTGMAQSTVPGGGWARGQVIRKFQPPMHPPMLGYFAYDPTDPTTWNDAAY